MNHTQCGFRPGRSITPTNFTPREIFAKSWEDAKDVYICFVDLDKADDRVPRENLWGVFRECSVDSPCYWPSSHCIPAQKFVSMSAKLNHHRSPLVLDSTRACAVATPFRSQHNKNWINSHSRVDVTVKVGSCRINCLLFADNLVLLASSQQRFQNAHDRFSVACVRVRMKISTKSTEVLCHPTNPRQCMLQVSASKL